jgi:hypothetical protein
VADAHLDIAIAIDPEMGMRFWVEQAQRDPTAGWAVASPGA